MPDTAAERYMRAYLNPPQPETPKVRPMTEDEFNAALFVLVVYVLSEWAS